MIIRATSASVKPRNFRNPRYHRGDVVDELFEAPNAPLEIERRFLVRALPDLESLPRSQIRQGYLVLDGGNGVRVRQRGDRYYQTAKRGQGRVRVEIESEISESDFSRHWPDTAGRRIEKTRYVLQDGEHAIEIDVFGGALAGKALVEVEFESVEACDRFSPPAWFGREVTEDPRYTNYSLATHGWPEA